jgi:hypothetical protein
MEKHTKILGVLFIAGGVLHIFVGSIVMMILAGGVIFANEGRIMALLMTLATIVGIVAIIKGIPEIIAGWGILLRKKWGRILGIIMAALDIFHIPFGTALGIYALWVLFNSETEKLLSK